MPSPASCFPGTSVSSPPATTEEAFLFVTGKESPLAVSSWLITPVSKVTAKDTEAP